MTPDGMYVPDCDSPTLINSSKLVVTSKANRSQHVISNHIMVTNIRLKGVYGLCSRQGLVLLTHRVPGVAG
jgi:hypothetical protein